MYEGRKKFKKLMLKAKQEYENEPDLKKKYEIEKNIVRYYHSYLGNIKILYSNKIYYNHLRLIYVPHRKTYYV